MSGRSIVISIDRQELTACEDGHLYLDTVVTTGRDALVTPPGSFSVVGRDAPTVMYSAAAQGSAYYYAPSPVRYALWFVGRAFAIHDSPWRTTYGPGSQSEGTHGCVNVPRPAMDRLYRWATLGTRVDILPPTRPPASGVASAPAGVRAARVPDLTLPSVGSFALDVGGTRLGEVAADDVRPIGSIAKTLTALLVLRTHPLRDGDDGPQLAMTEADVASRFHLAAQGASTVPVTAGERLSERDLVLALMLGSAANVAETLGRWTAGTLPGFVMRMNAAAAELGMTRTHLDDATGLSPLTVSTASDLVRLGRAALADRTLAQVVTVQGATLPDGTAIVNSDRLLRTHPGWLGIKTGHSSSAGFCFLFAARRPRSGDGTTAVGTVLGQPDADGAFALAERAAGAGLAAGPHPGAPHLTGPVADRPPAALDPGQPGMPRGRRVWPAGAQGCLRDHAAAPDGETDDGMHLARAWQAVRTRARRIVGWAGHAIGAGLCRGRRHPVVSAAVLLGLTPVVAAGVLQCLDSTLGQLPAAHHLAADTFVYDRNGELIAHLHPAGQTRVPVRLSSVARPVRLATVAVEDRDFWSEGATAPRRIVAATLHDMAHRHSLEGASTITQQVARLRYLDRDRTLVRKIREVFLARRLRSTTPRARILEEYLNDVYYGHGATGIEAAANVYFHRHASELDLAEAALLAGIPARPADLDPLRNPATARARQRVVLRAMERTGAITPAEAARASAEPLPLAAGELDDVDLAPAFVGRVVDEVRTTLGADALRDGLHIVTTLDLPLQRLAQDAVTAEVDALGDHRVTGGAVVAVVPSTGDVVAYVGGPGRGHPAWQLDMASAPRRAGLIFAPIAFAAVADQGLATLSTAILDAPYRVDPGTYDVPRHGAGASVVSARTAVAGLLPVPAVKLELLAGTGRTADVAHRLGLSSIDRHLHAYGPDLALGSYPVAIEDVAQAGATLGAGGMRHPARRLVSVRAADGDELLGAASLPTRAVGASVAMQVNRALRNSGGGEGAGAVRLVVPGHVLAVMTSTPPDLRDVVVAGWTPRLATGVWLGNPDDRPMADTTAAAAAASIWRGVMERGLAGSTDGWPEAGGDAAATGGDATSLAGWAPQVTRSPYEPHLKGHDISWPQCGTPLPSGDAFWVVGVTAGEPFTVNPCLADEVAAAPDGGPPSLYLVSGYSPAYAASITPGCASAAGLRTAGTTADRRSAWAMGCSEAEVALSHASSEAGLEAPSTTWWVDVEGSAGWSSDVLANRFLVAATIDTLRSHGAVVGLYSTSAEWTAVTGDWVVPDAGVPDWVNPMPADQDGCGSRGFSGGPVWVVQRPEQERASIDDAC